MKMSPWLILLPSIGLPEIVTHRALNESEEVLPQSLFISSIREFLSSL